MTDRPITTIAGGVSIDASKALRPMKPIPISAGKMVADTYGYDQVVIIGRRVGTDREPGGEHVTTYGRTVEHCAVAARMGDVLKHGVMGWPGEIGGQDVNRLADMLWETCHGAMLTRYDVRITARRLAKRLGVVSVPGSAA